MTTTPEQIAEAYFPSSYRDRKQCVKAINAAMAPLEKELQLLRGKYDAALQNWHEEEQARAQLRLTINKEQP
jgi:hypothetical protein